MILFEKYGQHQPLNRQRDRYAREGVDLSLSTLADQVGACTVALKPLHDLIADHVLAAERLHGDDTPVPVLAKGKCATGRAWVYVRDDRPFGGPDPPAALFRYSRNRSGDHPVEHLRSYDKIIAGLAKDSFESQVEKGAAWVGTPKDVRERIADYREFTGGFEIASLQVNFNTVSYEDALASMRLFSQEVMPHFR